MKVWLLKDGENLPVQENVSRMRTWMLADALVDRGHDVTWWSSTHSHQLKAQLVESDSEFTIRQGFRLKLLACGEYKRNLSIARYQHHSRLAKKFEELALIEDKPDVIVASFPTVDFAYAGVKAAVALGCMSVVDIRDPWPDIAYKQFSGLKKRLLSMALSGMSRKAKRCLARADVLYACSEGFLKWGLAKASKQCNDNNRVFYIGRPAENREIAETNFLRTLKVPESKQIVTFLGSFGHVYQLELICESARILQSKGDDRFHFVLAGDGEKGGRIRALAKKLDNVSVTGWLSRSDAQALLNESTIGLAPYNQLPGCLPNKIFEYFSSGLPVISSLEGDAVSLLEQYGAGQSYSVGDVRGFLLSLEECCVDENTLSSMRHGAQRLFSEKFMAEDIYNNYAESLEYLLDRK